MQARYFYVKTPKNITTLIESIDIFLNCFAYAQRPQFYTEMYHDVYHDSGMLQIFPDCNNLERLKVTIQSYTQSYTSPP